MSEFFTASTVFPLAVPTLLLCVVLLYWTFVILGALDIDMFHADVDVDVDGAFDGLGHQVGGVDVGAHDVGGHHDLGDVAATGILHRFGPQGVPVTIWFSFLVMFWWAFCLLAIYYIAPLIPDAMPLWLLRLAILTASLILSFPLARLASAPIAPIFVIHGAKRRRDNVGATCIIATGRVDHDFGQAKITTGEQEQVISVRCDRENGMQRHDKALVIDYDKTRHAYLIEPLDEVLALQKKEE